MKPGDYVRTKKGIIGKYGEKEKIERVYSWNGSFGDERITYKMINDKVIDHNDEIIKSSPNIIDLIEVGDYVNGLKVTGIGGTYHGRKDKAIRCDYCVNKETGKWTMIYDDEIKSILTKEQFESMEYKVKE